MTRFSISLDYDRVAKTVCCSLLSCFTFTEVCELLAETLVKLAERLVEKDLTGATFAEACGIFASLSFCESLRGLRVIDLSSSQRSNSDPGLY